MPDQTFGDAFQHLVDEFRSRHLTVCREYNDPIKAYLERIERDIAKKLCHEFIGLQNLHAHLDGNNAEHKANGIPRWLQTDGELIILDRYPSDLEPHTAMIRNSLEGFLKKNGFRSTVLMNLIGGDGFVRIIIHLTALENDPIQNT